MKIFFTTTLAVCLFALTSSAQWTIATPPSVYLFTTTNNVGIGTSTPVSPLEIVETFPGGATGGTALKITGTGLGSSSGSTIYGAQISNSSAVGTGSTQTVFGLDVTATGAGTGASPVTAVNANTVLSRLAGATITSYYGGKFTITGASGTSSATNVSEYGLYGEVANTNAAGEVSSNYGVFGKSTGVAGATTYGGYFTAAGGTTNYGVYSAAGTNYLNGSVGIGTTTPALKAHISGATGFPATSGTTQTGILRLQGSSSNGVLDFSVNGGSGSSLQATAQNDLSQAYSLLLNPNGGKVGVGTLHPDQALTVNGQVHSTSVLIESTVPADYVFNTDYYLRPLADVKAFVDKNHHLPEVPSAAEFKKDGMNVGDMSMNLLKKVEELTLYMIELNKTTAGLKKTVKAQQMEIERLKKHK